MAVFKRDMVDINLETGNIHRSFLKHSIGLADNEADHFGIRVFRDGVPVDLTGVSVQGYFGNPQGTNIAITTGNIVSGNEAEVVLPQACYAYEGQFCLAIKLVGGGVTGTIRIVDGMVDNANTGSVVAPTETVPTYQEVLSQYDAMVAATVAANTAIAETFDATKDYPAGKYVINEGALYVLPNGHEKNVTWANTTKTAAKIGDGLLDLKSAINTSLYGSVGILSPLTFGQGNISSSGESESNDFIRTGYIAVGKHFFFDAPSNMDVVVYRYDSNYSYITGTKKTKGRWYNAECAYIRLKATWVIDDHSSRTKPEEGHYIIFATKTITSSVTPQMFGAKADGTTDDTAAFQDAVNSGCDVYVPTSQQETYRLTSGISVPGTCRKIYSDGIFRGSRGDGIIVFDLSSRTSSSISDLRQVALFKLESPQAIASEDDVPKMFHISGIRITCVNVTRDNVTARVGLFISALDDTICDYDIRLEQISVNQFHRAINFIGRGCEVYNCVFSSINYIGNFQWDGSKDTNPNHPEQYNQRAISFKNNRFHSITSGFVHIQSGHAYGLTFASNVIDNGRGYLLIAEEEAYNWLVEGNLVNGVSITNGVFMWLKSGMRNCNITGNIFCCDDGYWQKEVSGTYISTTQPPQYWIKMGAGSYMGKCVISGNMWKGSQYAPLYLDNAHHNIITGNVFDNIGAVPGAEMVDDEHEASEESGDDYDPANPVYGVISITGVFNYNIVSGNSALGSNANIEIVHQEEGSTMISNVVVNNLPVGA